MFDINKMQTRIANDYQPQKMAFLNVAQLRTDQSAAKCESMFDSGLTRTCVCGQHQVAQAYDSNNRLVSYLA